MNAATETSETFAAPATAPRPVRPFYWSVMRELWENRSLFIAPLVVGGLALLILIYSAITASYDVEMLAQVPAEVQGRISTAAYGIIAWSISAVMHLTVFFYLLDALQGERKDRSVLFWKSMPVSDTTTVLSKMFTALIVSGAIVVAVAIATQLAVLVVASMILLIGGANPLAIWGNAQLGQATVALIYWQLAVALWYAPVAAWLLLVSAWAKRVTILWAAFIPLGAAVFERAAIRTHYLEDVLKARLSDPVLARFAANLKGAEFTIKYDDGGRTLHAVPAPGRVLDALDPVAFLSNPWLWVGLVVAAGFVAAAIWMRRYREPL
jgi:ABC-2 type transport system permease protein